MPADFKHLDLVFKTSGKRRLPRFTGVLPKVTENKHNRGSHGGYLIGKAEGVLNKWQFEDDYRQKNQLPQLPNDKPILINIDPEEMDLDFLRASFKFEVVCEYEEGFVIVATDKDTFSETILEKISQFAISGANNVARIYDFVVEESKEQRLKRILPDDLLELWDELVLNPAGIIIVEASISCEGKINISKQRKRENDETAEHYNAYINRWKEKKAHAYQEWDDLKIVRETEIDNFITAYGGTVLDNYDLSGGLEILDSFVIKIEISNAGFVDFASNYPYVFEITHPDIFELTDTYQTNNLSNPTFDIIAPKVDDPVVCVIDSGIHEGHVYIKKAIKEELSKSYLKDNTSVADEFGASGHGTRVTGAILYPNGVSHIEGEYKLPCWIANARILNEYNTMSPDVLPSKLLGEIFRDYCDGHGIRIFNHSINAFYPCRLKYMSAWATTIDNAAFERDILFIQSAGNLRPNVEAGNVRLGIKQHLEQGRNYPEYLLEDSSRIANPAQSMQALTVGSICVDEYENDDLKSFGVKGSVSSFSCTGKGIWDVVKPDVVEYGGDWIKNKSSNDEFVLKEQICPELLRKSPPGPAYDRCDVGTSYAAPKVTNIAAALQKLLPEESALLYKALIVQSARWTDWAFSFPKIDYEKVLRFMGYGLVNFQRATENNDYRVTYITKGPREISSGEAQIFKVKVPESVRAPGNDNDILVEITLTFIAKPRRTRKDFKRYFSTRVEWETNKMNESAEDFAVRILDSNEPEDIIQGVTIDRGIKWTIGMYSGRGIVKSVSRSRSATQKDWVVLKAYELPEEFCIGVVGRSGWSKDPELKANYALTVSFEALNEDLPIYVPFSVEIETETEETVSELEIEAEIEINNFETEDDE